MTRFGPRPPVVVVIPHAYVAALNEAGLSTRQLAEICNMPVSTVGAINTGARRAVEDQLPAEDFPHTTLYNARALAQALGKPVADLFAQHVDLVGGL